MTVVDYGKNKTALLIGGSSTDYLQYFVIGKSGTTITSSDTTLASGTDAQAFTSTSYPSLYKFKMQGDWNSVEMNGIQLYEFGTTHQSDSTGSVWTRAVIPAITFDGTNELRIEETLEIY